MEVKYIDINCDIGEGIGNESKLMPLISSCNIACGGHAGDADTMTTCVRLALEYGVKIGAHPSYPDRANFGRKSMHLEPEALIAALKSQLSRFDAILGQHKASLHHIKAHGALYNDLSGNPELSAVYLRALEPYRDTAALYAPAGSGFQRLATEKGFRVIPEAFADRAYQGNGQLVSRKEEGAVIQDPGAVLEQLLEMVQSGRVKTSAGALLPIRAETFCIHGDTPQAYEILVYLSRRLPEYAIRIAP